MSPRLKYIEYVQPEAPMVKAWLMSHRYPERSLTWEDVLKAIYRNRNEWDLLVARYKHYVTPDASSWGDCFSQAIVLCAVLRAIGFSKDSVFVMVACHIGESFGEALHATVILYTDNGWYRLDTMKPSFEDAILHIKRLTDRLKTNPYVCIFNDQIWKVAAASETSALCTR